MKYSCCRYCSFGVYVAIERRMLCKECGLVERDHVCPNFVLDPFKIQVQRSRNIDFSKYEKEDFSIE